VHARVTLLEIDTVRVSVDEALALFDEGVMPGLREQPGYRGVYGLATPDGKALLMSFWDRPEQAEAVENTWYAGVLEEYMTLFRNPPGRESYEVRLAEPPSEPG
jgi:hypothetical protein